MNTTESKRKSARIKRGTPRKEQDLVTVATNAAQKFVTSPLTLIYITAADFTNLVAQYRADIQTRLDTKGKRRPITVRLAELDNTINTAVENVKGYLVYKYQNKNAAQYYGNFGIMPSEQGYLLPKDRNARSLAIKTMIEGIQTHSFENEACGLLWWQNISASYKAALDEAAEVDGETSKLVAKKNATKAQVKKVLNSLVLLIKSNYPDDYAAKLREWGFQKEKY